MRKIIYAILILVLVGVGLYFIVGNKKENISGTPSDSFDQEYVHYKNPEYGPEFTYPKSWGEVTIKGGNKVCPEEDPYRTPDTLHIFDSEFGFDQIKLRDSESFIRIGIRTYELDPKKLNNCGDDFHLKIATKEVDPESLSSFRLNKVTNKNGLSGTYNQEASRLNTESRTQYTFFISKNSKIYILQPYLSFIPYFGSPELTEMEKKFDGDMGEYIKKGVTAQNIRGYLEEFRKMAESLKLSTDYSAKECYVATLGKDVYTLLILSRQGDRFKGTLRFKNFEKDSSSGPYEGTYKDGILLGDYSFQSEGMFSVVQVIFKKSGNDFVRGYGDMSPDGTRFADLSKITYDTRAVFRATDCASI